MEISSDKEMEEEKPLFMRFIQAGRLAMVQYGPEAGQLCFIVDIINQNRVLIDGCGVTPVARQSMPIKRIILTDYLLNNIVRGASAKQIQAALRKDDVIAKFHESKWGRKKAAAAARLAMTDFDRFKLRMIKKWRARIINKKFLELKEETKTTDYEPTEEELLTW